MSEHKLEGLKLHEGFPLITKDPQSLTNAVVYSIEGDKIIVMSDFGNLIETDAQSIQTFYTTSSAYEEVVFYTYYDQETLESMFTLDKLFRDKMELLEKAIEGKSK